MCCARSRIWRKLDQHNELVINPTYTELAAACLCGRSTAIRAIAVAVEIGIVRKARESDGRVSNSFELLLPDAGSNGVKSVVFNGAKTADQSGSNGVKFEVPTVANVGDRESSNGVRKGDRLKAKRKEDKIKKESQKGHRPDLALSVTRESNGFNAVNGTSETDAPIAPDFSSGIDAALHVPKPARETAMAARWNPICLKHKQQPELSANATSLDIGRGGFANGLLIDEAGNVIDEADEIETSSPDDRAPQSHYEAAYGDSQ
jgi:hypothetical protein